MLGSLCWLFLFASGQAAWVSTSNRKGASTPGKVGPAKLQAYADVTGGGRPKFGETLLEVPIQDGWTKGAFDA